MEDESFEDMKLRTAFTKKLNKYRAALQALNRDKGTHGNKDGMDEAHVSKNKTKKQAQSRNRADKKRKFFK